MGRSRAVRRDQRGGPSFVRRNEVTLGFAVPLRPKRSPAGGALLLHKRSIATVGECETGKPVGEACHCVLTLGQPGPQEAFKRRLSGVNPQPILILAQPAAAALEFRAMRADDQPELGGMVWFDQVSQFVDDDVIEDGGRGHDQPPVEGEIAPARAAAPLRSLAHDIDAAGLHAHLGRTLRQLGRDVVPGLTPKPGLQRPTHIDLTAFGHSDSDDGPALIDQRMSAPRRLGQYLDAHLSAAQQDRFERCRLGLDPNCAEPI
jgi:hypothetical protein